MTVDKPEMDLTTLSQAEIDGRIESLRVRMRPLETELAELKAERDVLITEIRRRERQSRTAERHSRRSAAREGRARSLAELVETGVGGSFEDYAYHLQTGGQMRLGFPGVRAQVVAFTNGRQIVQARSLDEATDLYRAGWEVGTPGRPGVRVHVPGSRQERLVAATEIFATPSG